MVSRRPRTGRAPLGCGLSGPHPQQGLVPSALTSNLHLCGQSPCREGCILHPARGKFCMFEIVPDRYPAARARPRPLVEVPVPRALRMRPTAPTRSSCRETERGLLPLQPIALPLPLSPPPAASRTWSYCRRRSRCPSSFVCRPSHLSPRASVGAVIRWRSSG